MIGSLCCIIQLYAASQNPMNTSSKESSTLSSAKFAEKMLMAPYVDRFLVLSSAISDLMYSLTVL